MIKENIVKVSKEINANDLVLDIGGWAQPFNRANYVIDVLPYETRGFYGSNGQKEEVFSKDTWIMHDVSSKKPMPFKDKEIDFVICSHVLEDIRNPIQLCSEIIRVGKRGYIEVPSRTIESIFNLEKKGYAGYYHHRWLVEVIDKEMIFRFKPPLLNNSWKYHLPKSYLKKMKETDKVSYFFWNNDFQYKEIIQIADNQACQELENFIKKCNAYPKIFYSIDKTFFKKKPEKYKLPDTPEIYSID